MQTILAAIDADARLASLSPNGATPYTLLKLLPPDRIFSAPTGRPMPAQGKALGLLCPPTTEP